MHNQFQTLRRDSVDRKQCIDVPEIENSKNPGYIQNL
jgi:hypothetical protein